MNNLNDNIIFFLEEKIENPHNTTDIEIQKMLSEFEEEEFEEYMPPNNEFESSELYYYDNEYTIKDLLKICEYYTIDKDIKASKCKKLDIISTIVFFESLPENFEIVQKRNKMWIYMSELINDQKMKKYVIWK
jgi:hypothetical protein